MSKQNMLNGFLFVVLVFFLWINTLQRDFSKPNVDILPDMAKSLSFAAFTENSSFANGQTIQDPVPGTIARGHEKLYYDATEEEALRAGIELVNPVPLDDRDAMKRGEFVYNTFCTPCHGGTGLGDGLVSMRGFPPPPSLLTGDSVGWADGHLFHIITYGGKNMSSYAYQVDTVDRWNVINYIRGMQADAQEKALAAAAAAGTPVVETDAASTARTPGDMESIPVIGVLTDDGLTLEGAVTDVDAEESVENSHEEPTDPNTDDLPEDEDAS